jgi:hypothetical protein
MSPALGTLFDVKKTFFDRQKVIDATSKADRKALGNIGGYVRKTAKSSIKQGEGISPPGSPPRSHTGRLKKGVLYGYDSVKKSVVVGPTLWRTSEPLELLEYGGATRRKGKPARYRARPFMGPAMDAAEPLDRFWKDSVKT